MSRPQFVLTMILVGAIVLQAMLPRLRLLIVTTPAGLSCLLSALLGTAKTPQLLAEVPWDVLVILIGLGLLSEVIVTSRLFIRPDRGVMHNQLSENLSVAVIKKLYRNVRLDIGVLLPALFLLILMLLAWMFIPASTGITPEIICWIGVAAALLFRPSLAERLLRTRVDFEAALFLLGLFLMVGAVRHTGLFADLASGIGKLPLAPWAQLVLFLILSGATTGLFSAVLLAAG